MAARQRPCLDRSTIACSQGRFAPELMLKVLQQIREKMCLTDWQISAIAQWQPTQLGFGRDDPQTPLRVQQIVDQIKSSGGFACDLVADDGLANYFVLFAYANADVNPSLPYPRAEGLLIYLSACGPVGVAGKSRRCVGPGFRSFDPLDIEALIDPDAIHCELERCARDALQRSGYRLLAGEEVSRPLPPGVEPDEYCRGPEPHDRVFHALFAETD